MMVVSVYLCPVPERQVSLCEYIAPRGIVCVLDRGPMFAVATGRHPQSAACRSIRLINMGEELPVEDHSTDVILRTFSVFNISWSSKVTLIVHLYGPPEVDGFHCRG